METKQLECDICHKAVNGPQGLATHKRWAHSTEGRKKMMAAARRTAVNRTQTGNMVTARRTAVNRVRARMPALMEEIEQNGRVAKCHLCDHEAFSSASGLRYHLISRHGKIGSGMDKQGNRLGGATCPECGYKSNAHGVAVHRRIKHGVPGEFNRKANNRRPAQYECPYCEFTSPSLRVRNTHISKLHPGQTGLVELRRGRERFDTEIPEPRNLVIPEQQTLKHCPNCGENLTSWRKE